MTGDEVLTRSADRPPLCSRTKARAAMSDEEFWRDVLPRPPEPFDDGRPDIDTIRLDAVPCTECGETGACAYDHEGRPLIHAKSGDDDE